VHKYVLQAYLLCGKDSPRSIRVQEHLSCKIKIVQQIVASGVKPEA
jgi:hypothetical protein